MPSPTTSPRAERIAPVIDLTKRRAERRRPEPTRSRYLVAAVAAWFAVTALALATVLTGVMTFAFRAPMIGVPVLLALLGAASVPPARRWVSQRRAAA